MLPFLFSVCISGCFWSNEKFNEVASLKLHSQTFAAFEIQKSAEKSGMATYVFKHGNEKLLVAVLTAKDASSATREQAEQEGDLLLQYQENVAPYPGAISKSIKCADEFKPHKVVAGDRSAYNLFANERFAYGVCSLEQIEYRAAVYFLHCNERFFQIKHFYPKEDPLTASQKTLEELRCE
jgi:hypothetical protein